MSNDFREIGISKELEEILNRERIEKPTPVQDKAIPDILRGKDLVAEAQTGTGKTLAFILPIMEKINVNNPHIEALVITPTRELAIQITNESKKLAQGKGARILSVYGGQDVSRQQRKLKNGADLVIATPGRLLDHIKRGSIELGHVKMLVLDEADEILNMGFAEDIELIIGKIPKRRQTMLFSATMPKGLRLLAKKFMKNPEQIQIQGKNVTLDEIEQMVIETSIEEKFDTFCKTIDSQRPFMAIIFCMTKDRVKEINRELKKKGYSSDELHGDLSQAKRERVIKRFRKMEIQLLVATDIAARGLDIDGITHIYNYDLPRDSKSYIHRIGRTGRAGESGKAISFVTPKDERKIANIEEKIKKDMRDKKASYKRKNKRADNIKNKKRKGRRRK